MSESSSSRWSLLLAFSKKVFVVLGGLVFFGGVAVVVVFSLTCLFAESVPSTTVIEVRLDRPLAEVDASDPFSQILGGGSPTLRATIEGLDRAREDDRVSGMIAYLDGGVGGMAQAQELRDAILRFRESGKFAYAFSETFGEMAPGTQGYYVAAAFDEVWMQPTGQVGLVGLMSSSSFYKGTFELLDVEVLGDRRREYKNAFNSYTERRYTEAHEEAIRTLLEDFVEQIQDGIGEGRGVSAEVVAGWIEGGPYLGAAATELGIVDHLGYKDEVVAAAREKAGEEAELLFLEAYTRRIDPAPTTDKKIALVYGVGGVTRGHSGSDALTGSESMGSETVSRALAAAAADEDVVAIVFRVDSPGGSAVASDTIWREVVRAREGGKPVIVSMGNVAASGGYYVAAGATKIVAQPGTITGSIGVFAGKPNLRKLWNKAGVTFDSVSTSDNALAYSTVHGYDQQGWESLQASLDQIYVDFKDRVARGRGMSHEEVEAVAKGRVWSGVRAKAAGLVDVLGGLSTAVALARQEAGVSSTETLALVEFPRERGWISRLLGGDEIENSETVQSGSQVLRLEQLRAGFRVLDMLGLEPRHNGSLKMPRLEVRDGRSEAHIR
ncbi:MAG: S49 family peptidase [Nannocystaceae bacterium]|nr:S49 family peptidase [Nannocystaceae bacterium]